MKALTLYFGLILAACGTEEDTPPLNTPQDEPGCLSCNVDQPGLPPLSDPIGSVQLKPSELTFVCVMGSNTCEDTLSTRVYNFTKTPVTIGQPTIKGEASRFSVTQENNTYPYILSPGHSLEIFVTFVWTFATQNDILVVPCEDDALVVDLVGKLFEQAKD